MAGPLKAASSMPANGKREGGKGRLTRDEGRSSEEAG